MNHVLFCFFLFFSHCTHAGALAPGYFELCTPLWGSGAGRISAGFSVSLLL